MVAKRLVLLFLLAGTSLCYGMDNKVDDNDVVEENSELEAPPGPSNTDLKSSVRNFIDQWFSPSAALHVDVPDDGASSSTNENFTNEKKKESSEEAPNRPDDNDAGESNTDALFGLFSDAINRIPQEQFERTVEQIVEHAVQAQPYVQQGAAYIQQFMDPQDDNDNQENEQASREESSGDQAGSKKALGDAAKLFKGYAKKEGGFQEALGDAEKLYKEYAEKEGGFQEAFGDATKVYQNYFGGEGGSENALVGLKNLYQEHVGEESAFGKILGKVGQLVGVGELWPIKGDPQLNQGDEFEQKEWYNACFEGNTLIIQHFLDKDDYAPLLNEKHPGDHRPLSLAAYGYILGKDEGGTDSIEGFRLFVEDNAKRIETSFPIIVGDCKKPFDEWILQDASSFYTGEKGTRLKEIQDLLRATLDVSRLAELKSIEDDKAAQKQIEELKAAKIQNQSNKNYSFLAGIALTAASLYWNSNRSADMDGDQKSDISS